MFNFSGKNLKELQKVVLEKQSSIDGLEQALATANQQKEKLLKQIKEHEKEQEKAQEKSNAALKKSAEQLIAQEKESQKERERLLASLEKTQAILSAQEVKCNALEEANKNLTKQSNANYESFLTIKEAREKLKVQLAHAQADLENEKALKLKAIKENNESFAGFKKLKTLNQHAKKKIEDQNQEYELLLIQLSQYREEQNTHFFQIKKLNSINQTLSSKVKRLMSRLPGYVDIGGIEYVKHDVSSETPQIIWKVTDYANGTVVLPEFYIRTTLEDGLAGIGVVNSLGEVMAEPVLIPQLISKSPQQLEVFKGMSGLDWQMINAAVALLEQMLISRGQSLQNSADFDYGFWQNSLTTLVGNVKRLPIMLRYQQVKLKRELQNPDYEHLWIELYDVEFGEFKSPKFEFRVSASIIEAGGFSKLPKLEFPLINGKSKPFESWFPESTDDFGQKFELRFSLENRVFDIGTFLRLSEVDQRLIQSFIFVLPSILNQLIRTKVSIHRKWDTWLGFTNELLGVFQNQIRTVKPALQASARPPENLSPTRRASDRSPSSAPAKIPESSPSPTQPLKAKPVTVTVAKKKSSDKKAAGSSSGSSPTKTVAGKKSSAKANKVVV